MKTVIAFLLLLATAAQADVHRACAPYAEQAKFLSEEWNETILGSGEASRGRKMEIWGDQKAGNWTFVLIDPDGNTCLMTAGDKLILALPGEPA